MQAIIALACTNFFFQIEDNSLRLVACLLLCVFRTLRFDVIASARGFLLTLRSRLGDMAWRTVDVR